MESLIKDFEQILLSPTATYAEGVRFLRGEGMMIEALKKLAQDLEVHGVAYSVIGAVALNFHGYSHFAEGIDLLLTREGLERFRGELIGRGYRPAFEGATRKFRETVSNVPIEVITSGEFPGDGKPKSVIFPDPVTAFTTIDGVKTLPLAQLLELKLASGLSAPHRLKDLADVQEMISARDLPANFANELDASVRDKFLELQRAVVAGKEEHENDYG